MLTPQEVAQRSFAKASFGGYNMAMVDDFLDEVTADYDALFKENILLKKKLNVLSDKVREYQSTEEAMRRTLLVAQEMSDKLVKETEAKCAQMLSEAENQSAALQRQLSRDVSAEEQKLSDARAAVEQYKAQIRQLCQFHLDYLDHLDQLSPPPEESSREAQLEQTVEEIQSAVERAVSEETEGRRLAHDPAPEDAPEEPPQKEAPPASPKPTDSGSDGVEESSISLYEQLMARRRGEGEQTGEHRSLEFGKDFTME